MINMGVSSNVFGCLLLSLCLTEIWCELFTSTTALHRLMQQGQGHSWAVQRLLQRQTQDAEFVRTLISGVHALYEEQPDSVNHPVTALRILKTFRTISQYADEKFYRDLQRNKISWPSDDDVTGAYHAVARIQKTYSLSINDVINGKIGGLKSKFTLEEDDVIGIAQEALQMGYNATAADWLSRQWSVDENARSSGVILCKLSNPTSSCSTNEQFNSEFCDTKSCGGNEIYVKDKVELQDKTNRFPEYESLCLNSLYGDHVSNSSLFCSYRHGTIPYIRYKQELYNLDPIIIMFHDVISDGEQTLIRRIATHIMETSGISVQGKAKDVSSFTNRVGQVGWVYDNWHPIVAGVSSRISDVTGASTSGFSTKTHAEPLQVCNYGIGGHFRPHQDAFSHSANIPEMAVGSGNRDATFMLYLSDVAAGGATVFPELGIFVKPVKNSAVFWYNMKRSGDRDQRLIHAGCPVMVGNKWIANKWLWSIGQTFKRRCGLTIDANDVEWALS